MRTPVILLSTLLLVSPAALAQSRVRIATYNIFFLDTDIADERKDNLRRVINRLDADVIGLQEIDDRAALEEIFPVTEWQIVIDDDSGDNQDVAAVVRRPLEIVGLNSDPSDLDADDDDFQFPDRHDDPFWPNRRDLLTVEVRVPDADTTFRVMVVHAKSRRGGRFSTGVRRQGASLQLMRHLGRNFDEESYVLLGDWNDNPDDRSLNLLETGDDEIPLGPMPMTGDLLVNLAEALLTNEHVSWGLDGDDILGGRINTVVPGSRARNLAGEDRPMPILFDQLLVSPVLHEHYVDGSVAVFDDPSALEGDGVREDSASDHLPVFADFAFGDVTPTTPRIRIAALLPNPDDADRGHEMVRLVNDGAATASIDGYLLRDRAGNEWALRGSIAAGGALELVDEAGLMPLNNSGDDIELVDDLGVIVDEVSYSGDQVRSGVEITFD